MQHVIVEKLLGFKMPSRILLAMRSDDEISMKCREGNAMKYEFGGAIVPHGYSRNDFIKFRHPGSPPGGAKTS